MRSKCVETCILLARFLLVAIMRNILGRVFTLQLFILDELNLSNNEIRPSDIAFYFGGECDVRPFAKMDVKMMPNALELVTKTEIDGRDDVGMV